MEIELRDDGGVIEIVADLYPLVGESAELVLKDYTLMETDEDEIDEEVRVKACEDLVFRMLKLLVRLDRTGGILIDLYSSPREYGGDDELDRAMERAVKSTLDNRTEVAQRVAEEVRRDLGLQQQGSDAEWLDQLMKQAALRKGLNKEEREQATLGEMFDLDK